MTFPYEKILTLSLEDYLKVEELHQGDFKLQGVHVSGMHVDENQAIKHFARKVPEDTEIVLGYRSCITSNPQHLQRFTYTASGTALIKNCRA